MAGLRWILLFLATAVSQTAAQANAPAVPRATRDLGRGHALSAADIWTESTEAQGPQRIGWITRRTIRAGEPLHAPAVAPPPLVRAGEPVSVRLMAADVMVAREGTAMMTGALGDRVRIRFAGQYSLTGVVAGPSDVRIP